MVLSQGNQGNHTIQTFGLDREDAGDEDGGDGPCGGAKKFNKKGILQLLCMDG